MLKKITLLLAMIFAVFLLFLLLNVAHFKWLPVSVVLYSSMLDVLVAAVIILVVLLLTKLTAGFVWTEVVLAIAVGVLLSALYAVLVPTIIDRSLSIYILEKLDQRGGGIRQDAFPSVFRDEYVNEHRLVDVRLTEQISSGTITIRDGCVHITPFGEGIVKVTRYFRMHFLPKKRELMGQISDDLTDPFRKSVSDPDYKCR